MVLDFEFRTHVFHHSVVQVRSIISNDLTQNAIAADEIILDESDHHLLGDVSIRCCFDPFGEVVDGH